LFLSPMHLSVGDRLGHYEILAPIGAGGVGEVYRARDTKLKREVALKVLPDSFAGDPERMARFQREAEVLAALNHPNIAAIYGIEDRALVMELVEGENLKGPLPVQTALNYARQIADALEAAHDKGITHRDLKPANIMFTPAGVVKVLDFGLATVSPDPSSGSADRPNSPTLTMRATQAGMLMGTAGYMSPEQAAGKPVDKRADIWSFGVVLWEMLTGKRLFDGETISHTLADVLRAPIDFEKLPKETPPAIRDLVKRCLDRDVKKRLRDIGEARIAIEKVGTEPQAPAAAPSPSPVSWVIAALALALVAVALWGWLRPAPPEPRAVVRLTATLPVANVPGSLAISRDGSRLAFVGGPQRQIYVRMLDQLETRPVSGTEGATFLCFSPDGQWISYVDSSVQPNKLKKTALAGGPAQILADAIQTTGPPTQDWGLDDTILFTSNGALMRIPAAGGAPQTLATPDSKKNELFYFSPQLLPGGKQVLFSIALAGTGQIAVLNLRTGEKKILVATVIASGRFLPTGPGSSQGHIVYSSTGSLMAVAFNASRMEVKGSPVPVLDGVQSFSNSPFALMGVSDSGTLAYVTGGSSAGSAFTLVWVDRTGVEQPVPAPPRFYSFVRLSPEGQRIALVISGQGPQLWVYDLARGTLRNLTSEGSGGNATWTPDGKRLIYSPSSGMSIVSTPVDASAPPSILASVENSRATPTSVSPDGKLVIGHYNSNGRLWVMPLSEGSSGNSKLQSFLDSPSRKLEPAFSPDGHWVAYRSDETGRPEIYVAPYPGPGGKFLISTEGGTMPRWSHDGRELFYRNGDKVMAVDIQTSPAFRAGTPKVLFQGNYANSYDVAPDGKRFLMIKLPASAQSPTDHVTVVLNWFEELRRRVPVAK
jgi:Tol biopolymer transport system component/predicted Ser/Thr protein kinase